MKVYRWTPLEGETPQDAYEVRIKELAKGIVIVAARKLLAEMERALEGEHVEEYR